MEGPVRASDRAGRAPEGTEDASESWEGLGGGEGEKKRKDENNRECVVVLKLIIHNGATAKKAKTMTK